MQPVRISIDNRLHVEGPEELRKAIRQRLTFDNPAYVSADRFGRSTRGIPKKIRLYEDFPNWISIPRGFWDNLTDLTERFNLGVLCDDKMVLLEETKPPKDLKMWEYQQPWLDGLLSHNQGVGIAPPGSGKTIMGLEAYARIGQPCLWLTHTKRLARQAMKRAEDFLGVTPGIIGRGKEKIEHFTVGLVPTLVRRDLSKYSDLFGMVIVDECHHVPASTFLKVVSAFKAYYRYGLTATPYRDDGLQDLLFHTLGPELAYLDKDVLRSLGKLMTPSVVRRYTKFNFDYVGGRSRKKGYQALADAVAMDIERNQMIATDVIIESTQNPKNVCIALVGRIPHGEQLYDLLSPVLPGVGFVHSKMTTNQSDQILDDFESGKLRVLIATYRMLAEGFDYQPSNRLFLTAPFKGRTLIEQACGRIERTFEGKTDAIVYDYVDCNVGVLNQQADVRLDIYEANNNPVVTAAF